MYPLCWYKINIPNRNMTARNIAMRAGLAVAQEYQASDHTVKLLGYAPDAGNTVLITNDNFVKVFVRFIMNYIDKGIHGDEMEIKHPSFLGFMRNPEFYENDFFSEQSDANRYSPYQINDTVFKVPFKGAALTQMNAQTTSTLATLNGLDQHTSTVCKIAFYLNVFGLAFSGKTEYSPLSNDNFNERLGENVNLDIRDLLIYALDKKNDAQFQKKCKYYIESL